MLRSNLTVSVRRHVLLRSHSRRNKLGGSVALANRTSEAQQLTDEIETTVADMYSDLGAAMEVVIDSVNDAETIILQDWGRLSALGPLMASTNYNGLGISASQEAVILEVARKGYSLTAMQELLPVAYVLGQNVSITPQDYFSGIPSYAQYAYSTFGVMEGSWNINFIYAADDSSSYPDSTVMQTDILDNGANPFELFSGINRWRNIPLGSTSYNGTNTNLGCGGSVVTLFNSSPVDMTVQVSPQQGLIASPGVFFNSNVNSSYLGDPTGSGNGLSLELRPYGYLPMFVTAHGGTDYNNLTIDVQTGEFICTFSYGSDGCKSNIPTQFIDAPAYETGWSGISNSVSPWENTFVTGLWLTLYQSE